MTPLRLLTRAVYSSRTVLTCDECLVALEHLADTLDATGDPENWWQAVQRHLARCPECREYHSRLVTRLESQLVEYTKHPGGKHKGQTPIARIS